MVEILCTAFAIVSTTYLYNFFIKVVNFPISEVKQPVLVPRSSEAA